jgi:DNA-binding beta-propeller fold protein YncE
MKRYGISRALLGSAAAIVAAGSLAAGHDTPGRPVQGTIWVANRGAHSIRGFDADSGAVVKTIAMAPNSQPGALAVAKRKIYVAEEFGAPPAIAIVDPDAGVVVKRLFMPGGSRPHHVHASPSENLVAVGLFGTDLVAVVDTHDDALVGVWDADPSTSNGRVHAGVFSPDGNTLYLASDGSSEVIAMDPYTGRVLWRMTVPGAHEIAVTHDGKRAYVSRRTANQVAVLDLENQTYTDAFAIGLPDTLALSANEKLLTVGLRTSPAQMAVVDTETLQIQFVTLSPPGESATTGAHQWTSPGGRFTFAAYEGGTLPGLAVIDHDNGHEVVDRLSYAGRPHGVAHAHP